MTDMICRKSMVRCQTPGMCSPHGGCQPEKGFEAEHLDLGKFVDWVWALKAERDQLRAENAGLRTGYEAYERVNAELKAEVEKLRDALMECTDSLQGEMLQKFGGQLPEDMHPVTRREYDRDIAEVSGYRAALGQGEQS